MSRPTVAWVTPNDHQQTEPSSVERVYPNTVLFCTLTRQYEVLYLQTLLYATTDDECADIRGHFTIHGVHRCRTIAVHEYMNRAYSVYILSTSNKCMIVDRHVLFAVHRIRVFVSDSWMTQPEMNPSTWVNGP